MAKENSTSSGIGFLSLLTLLFIGLKLSNHIAWSWWYVLLPMYGPALIVIVVLIILKITGSFD